MSMSPRQLTRAMNGLRPGDVLTNLNCPGCSSRKILVLARAGDDRYDFSVRHDNINIVRDRNGPWRWNEHEQVFRNKEGDAHDHIGAEVEVLEGAGLRELQWFRELPNPAHVRFRINPRDAMASFIEPSTVAKMEAIINRSGADDVAGFAADMQQAIDLIFVGSTDVVDERRMRYLVTLTHSVAHKITENSRKRGLQEIFGSVIMGGPDGLAELLRGGLGNLDDELGRGPQGGRRNEHQRGNGRDHARSGANG